ncbi:hypothetical protein BJX64DRAFT_252400 [Aspergillus heterothallicus]
MMRTFARKCQSRIRLIQSTSEGSFLLEQLPSDRTRIVPSRPLVRRLHGPLNVQEKRGPTVDRRLRGRSQQQRPELVVALKRYHSIAGGTAKWTICKVSQSWIQRHSARSCSYSSAGTIVTFEAVNSHDAQCGRVWRNNRCGSTDLSYRISCPSGTS